MPFKIEQWIVSVHKTIQGKKWINQHTLSILLRFKNQNKTKPKNHWGRWSMMRLGLLSFSPLSFKRGTGGPLGAWPMCWAASLDVTWLSGGAQTSLLGMAEDAPGDAVGEVVMWVGKNTEVYHWLKKKMEGLLVVARSFWMFLVLNWQSLECFLFFLSCFSFVRCFCSSVSFRSVQSDFLAFSLKFG